MLLRTVAFLFHLSRDAPAVVGVVFQKTESAYERDAQDDERGCHACDEEFCYEQISLEQRIKRSEQKQRRKAAVEHDEYLDEDLFRSCRGRPPRYNEVDGKGDDRQNYQKGRDAIKTGCYEGRHDDSFSPMRRIRTYASIISQPCAKTSMEG